MATGDIKPPKVLIAIPMLTTVCAEFFMSVTSLQTNGNTQMAVQVNSLVYDARRDLTISAIKSNADWILWLDSDVVFDGDILLRLLEDAEQLNAEYVSGLYFKRMFPIKPMIAKSLYWREVDGVAETGNEIYYDYPRDDVFEIAASGFGCVLVKMDTIQELTEHFKMSPFEPMPNLGEDFSFCWRMSRLGKKMYCDSRIKLGHMGTFQFNEAVYERYMEGRNTYDK